MKRKTALLTLIGLLSSGNALSQNSFNIDVSNDNIAIEANNASLKELLEELERVTGIPVNYESDTNERVSLTVSSTTLENAIAKITPNHLIVHQMQNGEKTVKELIVIPSDSGGGSDAADSSFLPNGQPAPAIEPTTAATSPLQPEQQTTGKQQPQQPEVQQPATSTGN